MLRKVGLTTALLLALPAFANAWTLTAKVGGGLGSITNSDLTVQKAGKAPIIGYFKTADPLSTAAQSVNVVPATGYSISSILLDGVRQTVALPDAATPVSVPAGTPVKNHSLVVYFTQKFATLKVVPAPGGVVTVRRAYNDGTPYGPAFYPIVYPANPTANKDILKGLKPGSKIEVTAAPNSDYKVTSIAGTTVAGLQGDIKKTVITLNSDVSVANSVTAIFSPVDKVAARLGVGTPVTSANNYAGWNSSANWKVGQVIPLDVTKSTGSGSIDYSLAAYDEDGLNEITAGVHFTGNTGVSFDNAGKYIVKLTATVGDASSTVSSPKISVVSVAAAESSTCLGCHSNRNADVVTATSSCSTCHGPLDKHNDGRVAAAAGKFGVSRHWNNHFEYGHEFTGGAVEGQINPNESYFTLEDNANPGCFNRCHFKNTKTLANGQSVPNGQSGVYGCETCHSNGLQSNGSFVDATSGHGGPVLTSANTCYTCHSGSKHGATTNNFKKSSHFTGDHAKLYYQMDQKACLACHDPHSTEAKFFTMSGATGLVKKAEGCQSCHKPGTAYGVFDAAGAGIAPHFGGPDTDFGASYITTDGATCGDCHGHNNTVNAGWAEGGHGDVNAVPWKSDSGHTWNAQGPAKNGVNFKSSPQQTNCIRCHSARGFAKFVDSGFTNIDQIKLADGSISKASAPLTCDGCHVNRKLAETQYSTNEGALRLANFTTAANGAKGYKAMWGYSSASIAKKKIVTTIALLDNRNSNICMPCHSQRASGQEIKDLFAAPAYKQYSAGSALYPHAAQPAAIWSGKGGYEFTTNSNTATYRDRMNHQRIGNGFSGDKGTGVLTYDFTKTAGYNNTGITQGSCVACHMNGDATHSLEITDTTFTNTCYKCHPANFTQANVDAKKADFDAAVAALGKLLVAKGITLDGVNPLPERKAFDMSLGTKNNAIAEKNMGAWFNWYLFSTADKGAYAHNPAYARRLITDSIDYLDDNVMNNSAPATILTTAGLTPEQVANAAAFTKDPGCMGCHAGTGSTVNAEAVPGIEQPKHFADTTTTNAQYVATNQQCNNCHGFGHGTDSPGSALLADFAESGHADVAGAPFAEAGDDFKTMASCNVCHTATGFAKFVNSKFTDAAAWGKAGDTTREIIACSACHTSTNWANSVRSFDTYSAGYGGFGAAAKQKIGYAYAKSNVCVPCHAARETGDTLAKITDFSNSSFKNPHYLGAAGVLAAKVGFHYYSDPAKYAYSTFKHDKIGMNNYSSVSYDKTDPANPFRKYSYSQATGFDGPCVACHMNNTNSHTLSYDKLSLSMPASTGPVVTPAGQGCYGCHATDVMSTVVEEQKEGFAAAMELFKSLLTDKGMVYSDAYPYFYAADGITALKNWTAVGPTTDGKLNMGAAFNFKLLSAEKGAFVHNRKYTKRLIYDSMDYLQNGVAAGALNFSNLSSATRPVSAARSYLGTARP